MCFYFWSTTHRPPSCSEYPEVATCSCLDGQMSSHGHRDTAPSRGKPYGHGASSRISATPAMSARVTRGHTRSLLDCDEPASKARAGQ